MCVCVCVDDYIYAPLPLYGLSSLANGVIVLSLAFMQGSSYMNWYVCVYRWVYLYICVCIDMLICVCIYVGISIYLCVYIDMLICVCIKRIYIYIYIYMGGGVYVYVMIGMIGTNGKREFWKPLRAARYDNDDDVYVYTSSSLSCGFHDSLLPFVPITPSFRQVF